VTISCAATIGVSVAFGPGRAGFASYGLRHKRLRKEWSITVARGVDACLRCGQLIEPGTVDLGHDDYDRRVCTGPEQASCNRSAAGRLNRKRKGSRVW